MKIFLPLFVTLTSSIFNFAGGHGYLSTPRSRNFYAHQEGGSGVGVPPKEFEPQSINRKQANQVCGSLRQNYDDYRDSRGNPMPWIPQGTYSEGQEIDIDFVLTANHWGHIEMYACPDGNSSTQDCFVRNPLTMVQDLKYDGPRDSNYPERGYLGSPNTETFRFRYRLPRGVTGNQVMLQWRYVTANSCLPRGYRDNSDLIRRGWVKTQLGDCNFPLNWTGQGLPEQFFNCAEVSIGGGGGNPPPTPPAPTPGSVGETCGDGQRGNGQCANSNECCSEWGWCGTSDDHCKNHPTPTPPAPSPTPPIGCGAGFPSEYILPARFGQTNHCYRIQLREGGRLYADTKDPGCAKYNAGESFRGVPLSNYQRTDTKGIAMFHGTWSGSIQILQDLSLSTPKFEVQGNGNTKTFSGILTVPSCSSEPTPTPPGPTPPSNVGTCGCSSCTPLVLDRNAGGYKVGARIDWLESNQGLSEEESCRTVCGVEFSSVCGRECNPDQCRGGGPAPTPQSNPGTCGNGNVGNGRCQNGECCSEWGWCGTSPSHCNK